MNLEPIILVHLATFNPINVFFSDLSYEKPSLWHYRLKHVVVLYR